NMIEHLDLAFYGIHGVEALFTMMGSGCERVSRICNSVSDIIVGEWGDGRIGTINLTPIGGKSEFGATAIGSDGVIQGIQILDGYTSLLHQLTDFFRTGEVPVLPQDTIEVFLFM